jgi:hypothetical protein
MAFSIGSVRLTHHDLAQIGVCVGRICCKFETVDGARAELTYPDCRITVRPANALRTVDEAM